jgi:hypothetical protein
LQYYFGEESDYSFGGDIVVAQCAMRNKPAGLLWWFFAGLAWLACFFFHIMAPNLARVAEFENAKTLAVWIRKSPPEYTLFIAEYYESTLSCVSTERTFGYRVVSVKNLVVQGTGFYGGAAS